MNKLIIAAAFSLAMASTGALAQTSTTDTTSSTETATPAAPPVTYDATKTQKTYDANGVETDKSSSYSAGPNGVNANSSSQTTAPDGSQVSTTHSEDTTVPAPAPTPPATTSTSSSSTTTTGQ